MKIAFAMINCNRRDGSARAVNEVSERLANKHEVHVFARKVESLDTGAVRWRRMPGPAWPEVADFATYHLLASARIKPGAFDIVHSIGCNARAANVFTIQNVQPAKQLILKKLGRSESVSIPRKLTRALYLKVTCAAERALYSWRNTRSPSLFLPVSRGVEAELRTHYDIGKANVRIVPNAADINVFKPVDSDVRDVWRRENGLSSKDLVAIFAGGEWARKGLELVIRALKLLREDRIKLFVAGDDPDRERYRALARELGVADRVVFGGFRNDIALALASSDVFVFPSWYEAFSLATIEAAACALPVVASCINGTEDFIRPGETGEFVEHDPEHIAHVLAPLLAKHERRRDVGRNARKLVQERYTWERVAQMTEEAYLEYLTGSKGRVAARL